MEGNRVLAKTEPSKIRLYLNNGQFDFVNKLQVNDKGILNILGFISSERQDEEKGVIKTLRLSKIKLLKNPRRM